MTVPLNKVRHLPVHFCRGQISCLLHDMKNFHSMYPTQIVALLFLKFYRLVLAAALSSAVCGLAPSQAATLGDAVPRQVLAFYYGWYGNPTTSGKWVHWKDVDPANLSIGNTAHFPAFGAYDSHDPAIIDRQVTLARAAGITGFISSWWGQGTFEDQGIPLLIAAAGKQHFAVSAYYEIIHGSDPASRVQAATSDLDYLLAHYGASPAWLRVGSKPVLFIYGRALHELAPAQWQVVIAQVRRANPNGVLLIADSKEPEYIAIFDGASTYNITGSIQKKSPREIADWARAAYPRMVAAPGVGKISTLTIIPGYDDRNTGRRPPRPVTPRWDDETYRTLWRAAIAARPDYVLITSWNEWHEGSEIEPSFEYGTVFLNDTAAFAKQFLAVRAR